MRNAVYYFQISPFVSVVFQFLKYANYPSDDIINNQILIKYDEKDILANLYQKCSSLCSKILLCVHHNMSIPVSLPWQYTGF